MERMLADFFARFTERTSTIATPSIFLRYKFPSEESMRQGTGGRAYPSAGPGTLSQRLVLHSPDRFLEERRIRHVGVVVRRREIGDRACALLGIRRSCSCSYSDQPYEKRDGYIPHNLSSYAVAGLRGHCALASPDLLQATT